MKPVLFASDLHLSDSDPETVTAFLAFLAGPARQASQLYLLGDVFEYWAGDDDDDPLNTRIAAALHALASQGTAVSLMHGNRDFLLGHDYARRCGATLLDDPVLIELAGRPLLLSHGDALCTDDLPYQQFRQMVRQPAWQAAFLGQPLAARKAEIARIRAASEAAKQAKAIEIMDVNATAVVTLLAQYPGAHLIHGHTHRPASHRHEVQHGLRQRWVLPDWYAGKGGYLAADERGLTFHGINQDAAWR
ncbi:UDP-2,3-diacylglucosamine diphosphatase [Chitinimonas sp. BJYL2]|uniref:UDP-2,3-diacylglucosamine diphosphatase n=1 Tax=Chitinimonas sp. BJYL2 TaxID=2976696 RepID=UPI0022B33E00|nr:UDP-2,3-diacylglucosamine diphosphatase [Chitinimonas sp. BJYL2]